MDSDGIRWSPPGRDHLVADRDGVQELRRRRREQAQEKRVTAALHTGFQDLLSLRAVLALPQDRVKAIPRRRRLAKIQEVGKEVWAGWSWEERLRALQSEGATL